MEGIKYQCIIQRKKDTLTYSGIRWGFFKYFLYELPSMDQGMIRKKEFLLNIFLIVLLV